MDIKTAQIEPIDVNAANSAPGGQGPKHELAITDPLYGHEVWYVTTSLSLATLHSIPEVKEIHDKVAALEVYARRAKDRTMELQAADLRLRAERRVGEILIEMEERGERADAADGRPE